MLEETKIHIIKNATLENRTYEQIENNLTLADIFRLKNIIYFVSYQNGITIYKLESGTNILTQVFNETNFSLSAMTHTSADPHRFYNYKDEKILYFKYIDSKTKELRSFDGTSHTQITRITSNKNTYGAHFKNDEMRFFETDASISYPESSILNSINLKNGERTVMGETKWNIAKGIFFNIGKDVKFYANYTDLFEATKLESLNISGNLVDESYIKRE